MKNQILLTVFGAVLGVLGTFFYDEYIKPRLYFKETHFPVAVTMPEQHKFRVDIENQGLRPAEDVTCRITAFGGGRIRRVTAWVNGESRAVIPDYSNAFLDKINYLNQGKSAIYEIEAEGTISAELSVLVIGKGVQAEKLLPAKQMTTGEVVVVMFLIVLGIAVLIIRSDEMERRRSA